MDTKSNPVGRPRKSEDGEVRSKLIKLRVTPGEHAAIRKAADYLSYDDIADFIRKMIMKMVKAAESGSSIDALYAIRQASTSAALRIPDLDFVPEITISNAETGEIFWESEPVDVE